MAASVLVSGNVKFLFVSTMNMYWPGADVAARGAPKTSRGVIVRKQGMPAVAMLSALHMSQGGAKMPTTALRIIHLEPTVDKLPHRGFERES